jgi:uncharacterized membrane protein
MPGRRLEAIIVTQHRNIFSEKGVSSSEFALVLPSFFLVIMIVFALALWLFSLLLAGTGVPAGARIAGTDQGVGAGYARVQTIMGIAEPAARVASSTVLALGAPGCARAVYAHLNAASGLKLPLLDTVMVRLRAGAQGRDWRFWAGRPSDGCQ